MHIRVIVPVLDSPELVGKALAEYRSFAPPGTTVSAVPLKRGTASIEAEFDSALAAPEVMRLAREAETDGVDACTIACFTDPGLAGARELVSIPIVGEGEASLHMAAMLANRFTVFITEITLFPLIRRVVARYGMTDLLASVRAAGASVLELDERALEHIVAQAIEAVERDGAEAFVMGCTGTGLDMAEAVEARLRAHFGLSIPVIDPGKVALHMAVAMVSAGLSPSKLAYPSPAFARDEYDFA
ncbi:allantoin racemase [Arboricoccus pini]|uniref:Allantoin racemase n=1 Tax=Arboricoccus pini TaxID=1963835 RepID=A0A212RG78_9PROT|nr:aspartate/glutamate racemase family protein [Arboricoccus pini]SNB71180.1 allantoin racemase [Arboricoccus pini]